MESWHLIGAINWLAVASASIVAFMLGGLWYSPKLFGNIWMQEVGLTEESAAEGNKALIFGGSFVLIFAAATLLAFLLGSDSSWLLGMHTGFIIGTGWVATAYGVTYLFERRSLRLFLINGGYNIVLFTVMGCIIGAWQ
jgi:hypothetical protein